MVTASNATSRRTRAHSKKEYMVYATEVSHAQDVLMWSPTSSDVVNLVLDEPVDQRNQGTEEGTCKELSISDSRWVGGAQRKAADCPWERCHKVRDHEDVMPVMIIRRCHICPSTTGQCPEDANASDEFWKSRVGSLRQDVPQGNQREAGA